MNNYKLTIEIDGDTALKLFEIGPKAVMEMMIEKIQVKEKDISCCTFEEQLDKIEWVQHICGNRPILNHKDNFFRDEDDG